MLPLPPHPLYLAEHVVWVGVTSLVVVLVNFLCNRSYHPPVLSQLSQATLTQSRLYPKLAPQCEEREDEKGDPGICGANLNKTPFLRVSLR